MNVNQAQQLNEKFLHHAEPLKRYIRRRLRLANLIGLVKRNLYATDDILDQVLLIAYENYNERPLNLSLDTWLYRITRDVLNGHLQEQESEESRQMQLEKLIDEDLQELDEKTPTNPDPELMLADEFNENDNPVKNGKEMPHDDEDEDIGEKLERKEDARRLMRALKELPMIDREVFEFSVLDGLPDGQVSHITGVPAEQVPRIVEMVKLQIYSQAA